MRTIIFTLDDRNATRFHNKRQSRDAVVAKHIADTYKSVPIYIQKKSISFFDDLEDQPDFIIFDSITEVPKDAVVFMEEPVHSIDLFLWTENIHVFRWNRIYPSLITDRIDLTNFHKSVIQEFAGSSHEKITEEIYTPMIDED